MKLKSWELWRSLFHHPLVNSPLFKNYTRVLPRAPRKSWLESSRAGIFPVVLLLAVVLCFTNFRAVMTVVAQVASLFLFAMLILLFLISAILPGMNLALKVSSAIFSEQEKGRYDLLALAPRGVIALHWALVMRCLRDDVIARRLREIVLHFGSILLVPLIAGLMPAAMIAVVMVLFDLGLAVRFFAMIGVPLLVIAIFYIDYIQSMVIAVLISVLFPAYVSRRSGGWMSWAAPMLFVAGQLAFYMGFLILIIQLNTFVVRVPGDTQVLLAFVEALFCLLVLFTLREIVIRGLWTLAVRQFEDDLHRLRLD